MVCAFGAWVRIRSGPFLVRFFCMPCKLSIDQATQDIVSNRSTANTHIALARTRTGYIVGINNVWPRNKAGFMTRLTSILVFIFLACAANAQDAAVIQLPFNLEPNKPFTIEHRLVRSKARATTVTNETNKITLKHQADGTAVFEVENMGGDLERVEGVPRFLEPILLQLTKRTAGLTYEYEADATGVPIRVKSPDAIRSFMTNMQTHLQDWSKDFAETAELSDRERGVMDRVAEQTVAPYLNDNSEKLSRFLLGPFQVMFYPTGRQLYLDYVTEVPSARYFEPGQTFFHTTDSWKLESYDLNEGIITVSFNQKLNQEKFGAFLERYGETLRAQHGEDMDQEVNAELEKYRQLALNRAGRYVIDLGTGLPVSGEVISEQVFFDNLEIEEIYFTIKH